MRKNVSRWYGSTFGQYAAASNVGGTHDSALSMIAILMPICWHAIWHLGVYGVYEVEPRRNQML